MQITEARGSILVSLGHSITVLANAVKQRQHRQVEMFGKAPDHTHALTAAFFSAAAAQQRSHFLPEQLTQCAGKQTTKGR